MMDEKAFFAMTQWLEQNRHYAQREGGAGDVAKAFMDGYRVGASQEPIGPEALDRIVVEAYEALNALTVVAIIGERASSKEVGQAIDNAKDALLSLSDMPAIQKMRADRVAQRK